MRLGQEPKGIMGSGYATSGPHETNHYSGVWGCHELVLSDAKRVDYSMYSSRPTLGVSQPSHQAQSPITMPATPAKTLAIYHTRMNFAPCPVRRAVWRQLPRARPALSLCWAAMLNALLRHHEVPGELRERLSQVESLVVAPLQLTVYNHRLYPFHIASLLESFD